MSRNESAAAQGRKFGPMTPRVLDKIEKRADLMAWDEHATDPKFVRPGSLADVFWNRDIPRLLAFVKERVDADA